MDPTINRNRITMFISFFALAVFASCTIPEAVKELEVGVPYRKATTLSNDYIWVIWTQEQGIVLFQKTNDIKKPTVNLIYGNGRVNQILLPFDESCLWGIRYYEFSPLPDERLGFIKDCLGKFPEEVGDKSAGSYLLAYDWKTGEVEQLIDAELPSMLLSLIYTWNPDMRLGLQGFQGLSGTIYWISRDGYEPMNLVLSDSRRSWNLADNFAELGTVGEKNIGIARAPAWSPDGSTIAFLASLDAIGRGGTARAIGEYQLFLMSPAELSPQKVLGGIYYPTRMSWSPDSQWLAFIGRAGRSRSEGLWMYSPSRNELVQVAERNYFLTFAWSPEGNQIATIFCDGLGCGENELLIFDVGDVGE